MLYIFSFSNSQIYFHHPSQPLNSQYSQSVSTTFFSISIENTILIFLLRIFFQCCTNIVSTIPIFCWFIFFTIISIILDLFNRNLPQCFSLLCTFRFSITAQILEFLFISIYVLAFLNLYISILHISKNFFYTFLRIVKFYIL